MAQISVGGSWSMGGPAHNPGQHSQSRMCRGVSSRIVTSPKPTHQWINNHAERRPKQLTAHKTVYRLDTDCLSEIETSLKASIYRLYPYRLAIALEAYHKSPTLPGLC